MYISGIDFFVAKNLLNIALESDNKKTIKVSKIKKFFIKFILKLIYKTERDRNLIENAFIYLLKKENLNDEELDKLVKYTNYVLEEFNLPSNIKEKLLEDLEEAIKFLKVGKTLSEDKDLSYRLKQLRTN